MTPLVLVHGFMGGSAQWDDQKEVCDTVIAVDLPGFGANAHLRPLRSIAAWADWVIAHLQEQGVTRYHLLGHSMGGMIAQEIARRDQSRIDRLVLYSTGAQGEVPGRFETMAESKTRATADGANATARRIAATWFMQGAAAAGFSDCADIAARASLPALHAGLDAMEAWSGVAALPDLPSRALVLWGDGDRTYRWPQIETLWTGLPEARLAVLPDCAHAVHLEKPALFNAVLADYLCA